MMAVNIPDSQMSSIASACFLYAEFSTHFSLPCSLQHNS